VENFLNRFNEDTTLVFDMGTTFFGVLPLTIPANCNLLSQNVWASIGYALPATLGVGLSHQGERPILITGDGAAQMTVQELGTITSLGVKPVVFLLNNSGYTIERAIQKPLADYHDIKVWDWTTLANGFCGSDNVTTTTVKTFAELDAAMQVAEVDADKMHFIEVILDPQDMPDAMKILKTD
jgi:indolepyruvate decarboxylase